MTRTNALAVRSQVSVSLLDDLRSEADGLLAGGDLGSRGRDRLADILSQIWQRGGDVLNYARLIVGQAVDDYCRLKLWKQGGYHSFADVWAAEGLDSVDYATVKNWSYAAQAQRMAKLPNEIAALQPIKKLTGASLKLRQALAAGDDIDRMIADLADPDVTEAMWRERYCHRPGQREPRSEDRATIDAATGSITLWLNAHDGAVGLRMGTAILDNDEAERAWNDVILGKLSLEWR